MSYTTVQRNRIPFADSSVLINRDTDRVRIRKTIPIANVIGSATFSVRRIVLNPANPEFGWLSDYAKLFETYKFRKVILNYAPSVSAATAGYVDLAVDWDITDADPASRTQLLSYRGASTGPVYAPRRVDILSLASAQMVQKYTSDTNQQDRTSAAGVILVSTNVASTVGTLFLEVDLDLFTPQIEHSGAVVVGGTVVQDDPPTNRYAPVPSEMDGRPKGLEVWLGDGLHGRFPTPNDVAAGFKGGLPIYTMNGTGIWDALIASTDGAAGANQSFLQIDQGAAYTSGEYFEKVLGTLSKVAQAWISKDGESESNTGWQPFCLDATAAVTDMIIDLRKRKVSVSPEQVAILERIDTF
jgi:hypothetical protein